MADAESDSSSDSENAGEVRNVARLVMRPPGHSGKAKKGHLVFDAAFEGGNLGRVDYIGEFEYDLFVRPDVSNPRYRVWFNFTVENVRTDQRVVFNLVNLSKSLPLYHEGFSPVVRSTSRNVWYRLPSKYVYYYRCPYHRNNLVLSWVFTFDREDDVYQFAFSYPYSFSRLLRYLDVCEKKQYPHLTRTELAKSVQGRRLDLLTITSPPDSSVREKKKVVLVTARVHPGETPSSYVCHGLITFLLSSHPVAQCLRDHVTFKIIPMLNPDGVFVGNYRTSLLGVDLNRCWQQPSSLAHPTLFAIKCMVEETRKEEEIDLYLDLHAHSGLYGTFIYGNSFDDVYRFQRHTLFPRHLAHYVSDFSQKNTLYNRDPVKSGTSRRCLTGLLEDKGNCYTLEVSFCGYHKDANPKQLVNFTESDYLRLGQNIAWAALDYYCTTGFISKLALPPELRYEKRGIFWNHTSTAPKKSSNPEPSSST